MSQGPYCHHHPCQYRPGNSVAVLYDPQDPQQVIVESA